MRRYLLPFFAVLGLVFGLFIMAQGSKVHATPDVAYAPATSPYQHCVAGSGRVEPISEVVTVSPYYEGKVANVFVHAGQKVKKGELLYKLDRKVPKAEMHLLGQRIAVANARLQQLRALPREEDLLAAEAEVLGARALADEERSHLSRMQSIEGTKAIAKDAITRQKAVTLQAEALLKRKEAELQRVKQGAWEKDLALAKEELIASEKELSLAEKKLDQAHLRAPQDGEILQVNVRKGEIVHPTSAAVILGDTSRYCVKVDVGEEDAWRIEEGASAIGVVRGNESLQIPLTFLRIHPYIIPKKNFTGDSDEKIDTRVLQVEYTFDKPEFPLYPGQMLDLFIEATK